MTVPINLSVPEKPKRYEIGLVTFYNTPATEKKGPYNTRKEAIEACEALNRELYPKAQSISLRNKWPRWMWAEVGEMPLESEDTSEQRIGEEPLGC